MKVSNSNALLTNQQSNKKQNKTTNFGNGAGPLVGAATFIENNGFLGEFLSIDAVGMITPRTIQGYTRNQEQLGHPNYKAGREELGRELLTGPAFFAVPLAAVTIAGLIKGKAAKVATKTLESFKPIMENASKQIKDFSNADQIKKEFLNSFIGTSFKGYEKEKGKIQDIKNIFNNILDSSKKLTRKEKNNAKKDISEKITSLNKSNGKSIDDTLNIKIGEFKDSKGEIKSHEVNIKELINDIPNYLDSFTKKAKDSKDIANEPNKFIENFHNTAKRIRQITNISAVASLCGFLSIVPKLSQVDKKFPGVEGLDTSSAPNNSNSDSKAFLGQGGQIANK